MPELRRSTRTTSKPSVQAEPAAAKSKVTKPKKESQPKSESPEIDVGDKIPDITLLDEDENEVQLSDIKTKYLVIFAYPKASTPGCTRQACGFQKNYDFLSKSNTTVYGLSADKPKSQKNFVVKQHLKYSLLSDPSRELIGLLGAKKNPTGIKRSHWIFVDGVLKVKKIQVSPEASVEGAKEDIEKFIKEEESKDEKEDEKKE